MGNRVTTPNLRFEWVDGQVTSGTPDEGFVACGDGTAFPMEVTLDQVAEIFYRVKDAWFTGGSASWKVTGSPVSISAPTAAPTNRRLDVSASTYQQRGYCKLGGDDYNGATYNSGIGSYYSDIADNENGMWRDAWNDPDHVDAFSFEQDDSNGTQSSNSQWWGTPYVGIGVYAKVQRGDRVAVVKLDPADGLYASTNKFYLEIDLYWADYYPVPFFGGTNIYDDGYGYDWSAYAVAICQYILRLESGDATCQVYFATDPSTTEETGTDFIHKPQVWWPYAKDNPAVPVWGIGNGAKL
jgi:hypothetical protein